MRKVKRKMLLMCTIALICAGVLGFTSCVSTTTGIPAGLLLSWLAVDCTTLLAVWLGEGNVSSENAKEQANNVINGVADFFDGIKAVCDWVTVVLTPQ